MNDNQVHIDANVMKFEGGDRELYGSYKICWHDCVKGIFACYSVIEDIWFCASTVDENMVYPMCEGLEGTEVRVEKNVVYGLSHVTVLLISDFEVGRFNLQN